MVYYLHIRGQPIHACLAPCAFAACAFPQSSFLCQRDHVLLLAVALAHIVLMAWSPAHRALPPLPQRDRVLLLEAVTYTREQAFTMVGTIANVNTQFTRLQQDHQLVNGGAGAAVNGMCVCWSYRGNACVLGYRGNACVLGL